ncbi:MAG: sigma-70 family RNA polymerase sigma factor [Myxococcota bacterium]
MSDLDHELPGIAAGDPDAFARWVAGAEHRVRASLGSVADAVDVEALVQETLLRIWQVAPRITLDGRPNAVLRLAVRIARNLAVSELRRQRVRPDRVAALQRDEPNQDSVAPTAPDPMLRELIAACRAALPGKPAAALAARLQGVARPDAALAAGLGMKLNTFLQNVTRARKLLAACLGKRGVDLEAELA